MVKTIIRANQYLEAPITDPKHLVNKQYVDDLLERNLKQPVRLATTENISGTYNSSNQRFQGTSKILEIDGTLVNKDDRILIKDQLDKTQNGIYIVIDKGSSSSPFILERSSDFNTSEKIPKNLFIRVSEGKTQADILFQLVNDETIVLDTTPIIFSPYKAGGIDSVDKNIVKVTGNGIQTSFNIIHNLKSEDVIVTVKNENDIILTNYEIVDSNSLKIIFDTPLENGVELKVIVFG